MLVTMLDWDELSSVNVRRFDDDHKQLFSIIDSLHNAMVLGIGAARARQVIAELASHLQDHFSAEESAMEQSGYPGLVAHRLEHQSLIVEFESLRKEIDAGRFASAITVAEFLDRCLKHTRVTDKKYSSHLNASGIF